MNCFRMACATIVLLASTVLSGCSLLYYVCRPNEGDDFKGGSAFPKQRLDVSPDGKTILFTGFRGPLWLCRFGDPGDIYSIGTDGTDCRRLTHSYGLDWMPRYSPDGSKITFISERDGGYGAVHVMNADGSDQIRLTSSKFAESTPLFVSNDKVVFTRKCIDSAILNFFNTGLFLIDINTRKEKQLSFPDKNMRGLFASDYSSASQQLLLHKTEPPYYRYIDECPTSYPYTLIPYELPFLVSLKDETLGPMPESFPTFKRCGSVSLIKGTTSVLCIRMRGAEHNHAELILAQYDLATQKVLRTDTCENDIKIYLSGVHWSNGKYIFHASNFQVNELGWIFVYDPDSNKLQKLRTIHSCPE